MKHIVNTLIRVHNYYAKHTDFILLLASAWISIVSIIYFYFHGNQNLSDYDALARLNIARKLIDSITPGIGQLGGIWLPFPQILFLPFIWNDFLWHSGLAGSIVSGTSFLIGAVFLKKTAFLVTKSEKISLFVWIMFVTNVNILLLQTMAMSESFFLFCLIMVLHFLTKWTKEHDTGDFLLAAFFVMLITLTRYEGYFVFIGSFLTVLLESVLFYWRKEGYRKVEGMVLLFLSVAGYGIFLWCIYCALFYKDPLYWLHLYSSQKGQISSFTVSVAASKLKSLPLSLKGSPLSFSRAFTIYSSAILWTNGIITTLLGLFGEVFFAGIAIKGLVDKKRVSEYLPVIIIGLVLFSFLIYGYYVGFIPSIEFPSLTWQHILSKSFNSFSHSNIRYGIILSPLIFLLIGLAASKNKILGFLILILFGLQLYTNFYTPLFLQFSFPKSWGYSRLKPIPWFTAHYDGGLILISANRHENFMFQTGLPYKDFIYEGTRHYWITSLNNPSQYSRWVIYDESITDDKVHDFLTPHALNVLKMQFVLVFSSEGVNIYRAIDKNNHHAL